LEVRDSGRTEPRLLRRREAEEKLGRVRDELGAGNSRGERHLLRQALPAVEATAHEPAADARELEGVAHVVEDLRRDGLDVVAAVAAKEEGDVVLLEDQLVGIARESDR